MATVEDQILFIDEVADFLASHPSREQILAFHPSPQVEQRFADLLGKVRESQLTREESEELDRMQQTEILVRLIKARLQGQQTQKV